MLKSTVTVEAAVLMGIKPGLMTEFWGDLSSPPPPQLQCILDKLLIKSSLTFRNVLNEQLFTRKVTGIRLCSFFHRGCLRLVQNRGVIPERVIPGECQEHIGIRRG